MSDEELGSPLLPAPWNDRRAIQEALRTLARPTDQEVVDALVESLARERRRRAAT